MESLKGKFTEEEFTFLCDYIHEYIMYNYDTNIDLAIRDAKEDGYIKQNPVEKAEATLDNFRKNIDCYVHDSRDVEVIAACIEAIDYLKKQLKEK